jgi:hypothetical protein
LWAEAAAHFVEILNRTMAKVPGHDGLVEPWLLEARRSAAGRPPPPLLPRDEDPVNWPPWGCRAIGLTPRPLRDTKLDPIAFAGIFVGLDKVTTAGTRVAVLDMQYMKVDDPITDVIVCTTVRTRDDSFPLMDAVRPSQEDLDEFVNVAVPGEAAGQPAAAEVPAAQPAADAAQPNAEAAVDAAMDQIFGERERSRSPPRERVREAAADASQASERAERAEGLGPNAAATDRRRQLLDDVPLSTRRRQLVDDLPASIRRNLEADAVEGPAASRRRVA